jgi:hypothetical protein
MIEIGVNDARTIEKPFLVIGEEKVIVFDSEEEKQKFFDDLAKNQPIVNEEIIEDEVVSEDNN